jgi:hypothetical protein
MPFHNGLNGNGTYHSSPTTLARVNSTAPGDGSELATLYQKFEHYQQYDLDKNKFMAVGDSSSLTQT